MVGEHAHAVDGDRVEIWGGSPDGDVAVLAALADGRDAGHAFEGLGGVYIGKIADGVGGDDIFEIGGGALLVDRAGLALARALDDERAEADHLRRKGEVEPGDPGGRNCD